jgi:heme-degrading monooxygenase HmoA
MYIRLVRLKVDDDKLWRARLFYEDRVMPELGTTPGCRFAGLLLSSIHGDDLLSMSIWDDPESATAYHRSGVYDRLLDESDEALLAAAPGEAAEGSEAEGPVLFTADEPDLDAGTVVGGLDEGALAEVGAGRGFVRFVTIRLRPDAGAEFERRYQEEVRPALAGTPGCLDSFLVVSDRDPGRVLSVTLWKREEDAVRYGLSGQFDRLTDRLQDLFSDLYQWRPASSRERDGGAWEHRPEPDVDGYMVMVGRSLS